jgi:hypothetical protein
MSNALGAHIHTRLLWQRDTAAILRESHRNAKSAGFIEITALA